MDLFLIQFIVTDINHDRDDFLFLFLFCLFFFPFLSLFPFFLNVLNSAIIRSMIRRNIVFLRSNVILVILFLAPLENHSHLNN